MSIRGTMAYLLRRNRITLSADFLANAVSKHSAQPWFLYAHAQREQRHHVCWPSLWLASRLPASSSIFESGCGCGLNLLWFAQQGFLNVSGSDLDPSAISVADDVFKHSGLKAAFWRDDGLNPRMLDGRSFDAVLALNWTYHVPEFELGNFLEVYRSSIRERGYMAVDVIDRSYDNVQNNQYLTSDWTKPQKDRRPSEYTRRYWDAEIGALAVRSGFRVVASRHFGDVVPRNVYVLRRR